MQAYSSGSTTSCRASLSLRASLGPGDYTRRLADHEKARWVHDAAVRRSCLGSRSALSCSTPTRRLSAPTSWNVLTVLTISKTHGLRSVGGHRRCTRRAAGSKTRGLPRSFACLAGSPCALDPTFFLLRADHRQVGLVVERTPWLPAQNGCCRNHITRSAFSKTNPATIYLVYWRPRLHRKVRRSAHSPSARKRASPPDPPCLAARSKPRDAMAVVGVPARSPLLDDEAPVAVCARPTTSKNRRRFMVQF